MRVRTAPGPRSSGVDVLGERDLPGRVDGEPERLTELDVGGDGRDDVPDDLPLEVRVSVLSGVQGEVVEPAAGLTELPATEREG